MRGSQGEVGMPGKRGHIGEQGSKGPPGILHLISVSVFEYNFFFFRFLE